MTDAAKATVTSVLATRPNQFVDFSRNSILAHIVGIKLGLASGSGQTARYARNNSSRRASSPLEFWFEFPCSIGLLKIIIPLFQLPSSSLATKDEGPVTSFTFFNTRCRA